MWVNEAFWSLVGVVGFLIVDLGVRSIRKWMRTGMAAVDIGKKWYGNVLMKDEGLSSEDITRETGPPDHGRDGRGKGCPR